MAKKSKKTTKNQGITLIKKANSLIESRYKFNIWETRVFLIVLGQIRRNDDEFKTYRIWYKDVIKLFGICNGGSYNHLRSAVKSLMNKCFFITYDEDGVVRTKQYHIFREADYLEEGQQKTNLEHHEYVDVTIEIQMQPFLLELQKNFTAYDLQNIVKLGVYPVRVYELLKQYEKIGRRRLEVEEMKKMFEVTEQYRSFADFFRWIVKPAIKEINAHTDLTVTDVGKIKSGRRIVALEFTFHLKKGKETTVHHEEKFNQFDLASGNHKKEQAKVEEHLPGLQQNTQKDELFKLFFVDVVERFGVTPSVFLKLLESFSEEQVRQAINVTNRAKYNNQVKSNIAGFFVLALKQAYTDSKEEAKKLQVDKKFFSLKEQIEELNQLKAVKINDRIKEVVAENPTITEQAIAQIRYTPLGRTIIQEKEKALERLLIVDDYREDRILRELVKAKIVELASAKFADIIDSFESMIKQLQINSQQ